MKIKDDETLMTLKTLPSPQQIAVSLVQEDIFVEPAVSTAAPQLQRPSNSWIISSIRADDRWPNVNVFHTTGHQNR